MPKVYHELSSNEISTLLSGDIVKVRTVKDDFRDKVREVFKNDVAHLTTKKQTENHTTLKHTYLSSLCILGYPKELPTHKNGLEFNSNA